MQLAEFIKSEAVFFGFEHNEKQAILAQMIAACCEAEGIVCHDDVRTAVLEREADRSTGIGRGLAVPHCRCDTVVDFHISVAVLQEGIDWDALDERPVQFIFLVIGPVDKPETYLQLLSQISRLIRLPDATKRLLAATTPAHVLDVIHEL